MKPVLRALTDVGPAWDDPSEDLLFELLGDVDRGEATFVIVERSGDASGLTYIQAIRNSDGSWQVERREGSADRHFGGRSTNLRSTHDELVGWAFKLRGWRTAVTWEPMTIQAPEA